MGVSINGVPKKWMVYLLFISWKIHEKSHETTANQWCAKIFPAIPWPHVPDRWRRPRLWCPGTRQSYCVLLWSNLTSPKTCAVLIWWFPKMGVPPNHPFQMGFSWFSTINHPLLATPMTMETPYVTDKKGQSWPVCFSMFLMLDPHLGTSGKKRSRFQKIIQSSRCLVGHREAIGDVHCTSLTSDVLAMGSSSYA